MSEYCIELEHVSKRFGKFKAVDDVSLKLLPGKVYGFVGPNGAGKSTTMAIIMGTLFPSEGKGFVMGQPIASKAALSVLGYSPEFTSFYSDMSCLEYLWYMGTLGGLSSKEALAKANALIDEFDLRAHAGKRVAKFSTGMKKKVSLAQAMIHDPQILLLDEPTANLDPSSRMEILDIVREMVNGRHLTVLISSHVLTELETVIDHVIMINHGRIILDDEISKAKEKFAQGNVIVSTSNNALLLEKMKGVTCYQEEENLRFVEKDTDQLKRQIVKTVYENDLQLNLLREDIISLDSLYRQTMEGIDNETHSN